MSTSQNKQYHHHQLARRKRWASPISWFLLVSLLSELSMTDVRSSVTAFQVTRSLSRPPFFTKSSIQQKPRYVTTRLFDSEVTEANMDLSKTLNPSGDDPAGGRTNGDMNGAAAVLNGAATLGAALQNGALNGGVEVLSNNNNGHSNSTHDVPRPTENGGFSHTSASRAKISAANKGKTPWNKGKTRSEETKARIAAGVRAKNRERFLKKLQDEGITEEEHTERKKTERRKKDAERRARKTAKGGYRPTEETRKKISNILKEKWANGEIKKRTVDPNKVRKGFTHSNETRAKISATLRNRWANDDTYRKSMVNKTTTANIKTDTRKRISETLKAKWQDPEFREKMMKTMKTRKASTGARGSEYRKKISAAMKAKWQDEEYRERTTAAIRKRAAEMAALRPPRPPKKRKPRPARKGRKPALPTVRLARIAGEPPRRRKKPLQVDENGNPIPAKVRKIVKKKVAKTKKAAKVKKAKKAKAKKAKKEPDGSINRLRDERRDLYDLLYGDEDGADSDSDGGISAMLDLEDENLDTFDPYGLEEY